MNITSYNIGDVTFHYVALRVLRKLRKGTEKAQQFELISQSIYRHVCSRSLRLMLPEPRGTYKVAGEKVCRELAHFGFVHAQKGRPYSLTRTGLGALDLLETKNYTDLRRLMAQVHLRTYNNLRAVFLFHLDGKPVWRPVVEEARLNEKDYLARLLAPSLGGQSASCIASVVEFDNERRATSIESVLTGKILERLFGDFQMRTALFRTICDRLASLRLLNVRRDTNNGCEFNKTYSPCKSNADESPWYSPLEVSNGVKKGLTRRERALTDATDLLELAKLRKRGVAQAEKRLANAKAALAKATEKATEKAITVYLSEPDMKVQDCQDAVLNALDVAFRELPSHGGYHAIPDLRDFVCERLMIPEPAFDEAVNALLDRPKAVLSAGLGYELITAQRRPIVRKRSGTQLHNLLRRVK